MKLYRTFVQPYLFWMSIFIVVPMLLIVFYAFTTSGNDIISFRFTLDNFLKFSEPIFLRVLLRSLSIAMLTTLISIVLGYPVAYLISQTSERVQTFLILLITIPMWINMLVRTYAWIGILSENGLINSFMTWLGLPTLNLMYTDFAVILGMVYNFLPFMILSIYTVLAKLDKALIQASYDLGANKTQTFLKVVLPLSVPGIISGITLVFLPAVSTFVIPRFLGGGNFVLIGNLIETQFITVGEWNFGSAISMIMASVIMLTMFITKRFDQDIEEIQTRKEVG
ncbi:MAG: ABC transporter permease [Erysipelotrichia bacterium]|jgi:spermidine/putrescine transport system permease protein|nr:ABC transporter permease [Erysipelotrichia bacterium]